jgi:transposase-like protein
MSGGLRRKTDYIALDDVGYDMVDALIAQRHTHEDLAKQFGVTRFNLELWIRRQRTLIWLEQMTPFSMVDLLCEGHTAASIAREHGVQLALVERWIRENVPAEHLSEARDNAAEAMFEKNLQAIRGAKDDLDLAKAKVEHQVQRFHATSTTRRFTDDRTVKVTPGEGLSVSFSFTRKKRETGETEDDGAPPPEF